MTAATELAAVAMPERPVTELVAEALEAMGAGEFTVRDLLGVVPGNAMRLGGAVSNLVRGGWAERLGGGRFRFVGAPPGKAPKPGSPERTVSAVVHRKGVLAAAIYRAMHLRVAFGTREIVTLTGADRSYVRMVIRELMASDEIEAMGRRRDGDRAAEGTYRIRDRDRFYLAHVRENFHTK